MRVLSATVLVQLVIIFTIASCGGRSLGIDEFQPPAFQLSVLPETAVHGASECAWDTAVEATETGCIVTVSAAGAVGQKALYFDLEYDAESLHPVAAEPLDSALDCEPLSVSILDDRGVVHYGMILPNPAEHAGLTGDGALARVEFAYGAAACSRRVSGVPVDNYSSANLCNWNSPVLTWFNQFSGDCNQDGIVTVTDLTPIGVNYQIGFTPENFWQDYSELYAVDTDRNFEITVADITAIGRNYGKDILGGFNVYGSTDYLDYPDNNDGANGAGASLIGKAAFQATDSGSKSRKLNTFEVPTPDTSVFYWVRPVDSNGNEGTPSRMITQIGLNTSREDAGAAELLWDAESSNLVWGYNFPGDYNQDGWVTVWDITPVGQQYYNKGPFAVDSIAALIDSNHDQVISVRDFYNIAVHYDRPFYSYEVFGSDDPSDYPMFNDSAPVVAPFTGLSYVTSDFDGPRNMYVRHIDSLESGMYFWVRLIDENGLCGTPSNMIQIP